MNANQLWEQLRREQRRRHRKGEETEGRGAIHRLEGEIEPDFYFTGKSRKPSAQ